MDQNFILGYTNRWRGGEILLTLGYLGHNVDGVNRECICVYPAGQWVMFLPYRRGKMM